MMCESCFETTVCLDREEGRKRATVHVLESVASLGGVGGCFDSEGGWHDVRVASHNMSALRSATKATLPCHLVPRKFPDGQHFVQHSALVRSVKVSTRQEVA